MDLSKYPVTTPFGWVEGYPLNQTDPVNHPGQGYHNGIDYGLPMNTPVIVNGVQIASSNNTGDTTGPHLHVGKFVGGVAVNPGLNQGANFDKAVIYDTGKDDTNGNFVRITADGALWNYLHLADGSIKVKAGQVLQAGSDIMTRGAVVDIFFAALRRNVVTDAEYEKFQSGEGLGVYLQTVQQEGQIAPLSYPPLPRTAMDNLCKISIGRPQVTDDEFNTYHDDPVGFSNYLINVQTSGGISLTTGEQGFTNADRVTANETNSIVKSIQDAVNKLISYWKV